MARSAEQLGQAAGVVLEWVLGFAASDCKPKGGKFAKRAGVARFDERANYKIPEGCFKVGQPKRPSEHSDGLLQLLRNQTENEEPQPQVVSALGLRMTNCEPCRLSV